MARINQKVILINGFARGGTNLVWNIFQSHPAVSSVGKETGELFALRGIKYSGSVIRRALRLVGHRYSPLNFWVAGQIDRHLHENKLATRGDQFNRYKTETEIYSDEEFEGTALCLKSVNNDLDFTNLLSGIFDDFYVVGLVRNGYALCEGWMRRGDTPEEIGKYYQKYCDQLFRQAESLKNFRVVKFEDITENPFGAAKGLFEFANLTPTTLPKIRLKVKKTLSISGQHGVQTGLENHKYWLDETEIQKFVRKEIDQTQAKSLTEEQRKKFSKYAMPALKKLGYESL